MLKLCFVQGKTMAFLYDLKCLILNLKCLLVCFVSFFLFFFFSGGRGLREREITWIYNYVYFRCCVCVFLLFSTSQGFKFFQTKIPNGDSVPHPCKPNYRWYGVGHQNELGGGSRNPFGLDFDAAGKVRNLFSETSPISF